MSLSTDVPDLDYWFNGPNARRGIERVWDKVEKSDACWFWTGRIARNGYGMITAKRAGKSKGFMAHRLVYQMEIGPIPVGLDLDHLCRNRSCVNPGHLEPVTRRENSLRGASPSVVAYRSGRCVSGLHDMTEPSNVKLQSGKRLCKACIRERHQRYNAAGGCERRSGGCTENGETDNG